MERIKDHFTGRMLKRLVIPSLISSLGLAAADMVDAIVIGQRMGATGLAAISLNLPLYMIFNVFMHGLGIGGSVKFSQLMGEGRKKEANDCFNRVMGMGIIISFVIAIIANLFPNAVLGLLGTGPEDGELFFASRSYMRVIAAGSPLFFLTYMLGYFLRSDENQKLASIGFLIGNITDIGLNILFVLVLDRGTAGAAWATLIGLVVTLAMYIPGVISKNHSLRPSMVRPNIGEVISCFKVGLSTSSQYLFQMVFLVVTNNVLMTMAGENGVAVFDMIQNASYLILYLYDGTAKASQPLVSTFFGEKNTEASRRTLLLSLIWGIAAGGAATLLICIFPEFICLIFGISGSGAEPIGITALRIYGCGATFAGISIILESFYQSVNEERKAFFINLLRGCVVLIPCTFIFSLSDIETFWFVYPVTEIVSLGIFTVSGMLDKNKNTFDSERVLSFTIRGRAGDLGDMTARIEDFCDKWRASPRQAYFVTMAAEEVCLAIIQNAFQDREDGEIQVTLVALENLLFELHIRDNAESFDPFSLETDKVGGEKFEIDAMGMLVIKKQAKDFFYRHYQGFNSLVVRI